MNLPRLIPAPSLNRRQRRPSPAMAVARLALLVALGGTSVAAVTAIPKNSVGTPQLRKQAVTSSKVKNGTLATADVQDGSLLAADFLSGQLPAGPHGPQGDQGPSGVVMGATSTGGGPEPASTTQFFGVAAPVTVSHPSQRVLVIASNAFGTWSSAAGSLNLFICYQQPGGPVTLVGNGLLGQQLPPNTKVPMGMSKVLTLPVGQYLVGMCGTRGPHWTNNDWGTTTALVFTQQ